VADFLDRGRPRPSGPAAPPRVALPLPEAA
jgi:hypothetical protein